VNDLVTGTALATLVLGFGSGVLAGMFGIGGAVLTTPAIRVLGATPIQGVGSTVPAILPGSISGAYRYAKEGLVNWRVGLVCGFTGGLIAAVGAWVSGLVNAHYLMVATAGLMAFSGISLIRSARSAAVLAEVPATGPEGDVAESIEPDAGPARDGATIEQDPERLEADLGLPRLMLPAFTGLLKLPIKVAVGSSLVAVAIFSLPALITHAVLGHIAWRFAVPLLIGVVPGAQVGARLSFASSDVMVRRLFGWSVLAMSLVYGTSELLGLR
jgi:uncharacterized membrane protein YfcA